MEGLDMDMTTAQAVTEILTQRAWDRLRQRKRDKPDMLFPWHWLSPRKDWILLKTLVERLKLPKYGWTSVDFWCPHYRMGTQGATGTHVPFIPQENYRDKARTTLNSLAARSQMDDRFAQRKHRQRRQHRP